MRNRNRADRRQTRKLKAEWEKIKAEKTGSKVSKDQIQREQEIEQKLRDIRRAKSQRHKEQKAQREIAKQQKNVSTHVNRIEPKPEPVDCNHDEEEPSEEEKIIYDYPAWYHRVTALAEQEKRWIRYVDFDEDLSELGEGSDEDEMSDDWDYLEFIETKDMRRERKREIIENAKVLALERKMEDEARNPSRSPSIQSDSISLDGTWNLYSSEYANHCYSYHDSNEDDFQEKKVTFEFMDAWNEMASDFRDAFGRNPPRPRHAMPSLHMAHIYFGHESYTIEPFKTPSELSQEWHEFVAIIPWAMTNQKDDSPPEVPDTFTFVGIREEKEDKAKSSAPYRSSSPKESWFEMNHPMGSWAQSQW
ncbi:hypothetical protein N7456_004150 [Penicillium angulare]|uniref:Uncharacterized protein n=1 Tax=Penicillium angulare TaxID=116970 RepID=A0A9W9KIA2_9EURO|nr:hypothetical protein N7456_004150 [Penicillium angulare]